MAKYREPPPTALYPISRYSGACYKGGWLYLLLLISEISPNWNELVHCCLSVVRFIQNLQFGCKKSVFLIHILKTLIAAVKIPPLEKKRHFTTHCCSLGPSEEIYQAACRATVHWPANSGCNCYPRHYAGIRLNDFDKILCSCIP